MPLFARNVAERLKNFKLLAMSAVLLQQLKPFIEFQQRWKADHGRLAEDSEITAELQPLLRLYKENRADLLKGRCSRVG